MPVELIALDLNAPAGDLLDIDRFDELIDRYILFSLKDKDHLLKRKLRDIEYRNSPHRIHEIDPLQLHG